MREGDTVGRLGGDEFVILLDPAALTVSPEVVAERVLDAVREPIELDGARTEAAFDHCEHRNRRRAARLAK